MPSPTLAFLSLKHSARFNFNCKPCGYFRAIECAEMMAIYGEEMTLENLKRRIVCKSCRMPVDGDFRRFDFYSADTLDGFGVRVD